MKIAKGKFLAVMLFFCAFARGQTTSTSSGPATQPTYAQQLAGVGSTLDAVVADKTMQVQAAQQATSDALAQLANVKSQLDAANARIADLSRITPAVVSAGTVPAGTSVDSVIRNARPGDVYVFGAGDWMLNGPVTLTADNVQLIGMPGANLHRVIAPKASSAIIFDCNGSRVAGFNMLGPGMMLVEGKPTAPIIDAPGFPGRYPPGNEISDNRFPAGIEKAIWVKGSARNTLITKNVFARTAGDEIFDCGYQTILVLNQFAGSDGDHSYRQDQDDTGTATNSLLAFNYSDNRTGTNKLEDFTFRSVGGSIVIGNTLMAWSDIVSGGPSYWRANVLPTLRPGGAIVQGNSGRARASYYFDQNFLPASQRDSGVTLYASGDLITRNNVIVNPPAVYKQVFATIARDQQTPFDGRQIELGNGNVLTTQPATQPSTRP
jgi:hypothetical protein